MSKKKVPKGAFHGPAGGFFAQKKRVVFGNVKHSDDERDISLSKLGPGDSVYFDVNSLSGNDEDVGMTDVHEGSLLGSAATTPKAKHVDTGIMFGSPLGSPDFTMDDDKIVLPPRVSIPLDKKWIDSKIVKTQIEVSVRKFFALDINLSAVEGKLATAKTQVIRKLFAGISNFGGAIIPSKFKGIIISTFTSEASMEKAISLAKDNNIIVNTDFKRQGMCSDRAVVIKEIPMNTSKKMIITTVAEFENIKSIKIQLIGMWQKAVVEFAESGQADQLVSKWSFLIGKDSVRVAKAVGDCNIWVSRNCFRVLLFTLPVGTTVHDIGTLLDKVGEKTCVINCSLETGNRFCCAVVCFESVNDLNLAFLTESILDGVQLSWARFDLVQYGKCGHFGYSALECDASIMSSPELSSLFKRPAFFANHFQLARLYAKKNVPISHPAAFGSKLWTQVVSLASFSVGSSSSSGFGSGAFSYGIFSLSDSAPLLSNVNSSLSVCLASLEHSLELLNDQVSGIMHKLNDMNLVLSVFFLSTSVLAVPAAASFDMALNDISNILVETSPLPFSGSDLGSSSSKVLTSKVGSLESKLLALNASVGAILEKLDQFDLIWRVATCNVRQEDIVRWHFDSGNLISVVTETKLRSSTRPWIADKFDGVRIFSSGLDVGFLSADVAIIMDNSLAHHVSKVKEVPGCFISVQLFFKGKLSVSVLGLYASAFAGTRFGQASEINLFIAKAVNSSTFVVLGSDFNKDSSRKNNSRGVEKVIDFIFVSEGLSAVIAGHGVASVQDFFDMDHKAVSVSIGLGGLLNAHLNSIHKQANKNRWKFRIKDAKTSGNLDAMWEIIREVVISSADKVFSRFWFSEFKCLRNKQSLKFFKLELLVAKLIVVKLIDAWSKINVSDAAEVCVMVDNSVNIEVILHHLLGVRKKYYKSKYFESRVARVALIRKAIDKHMENFCSDKGCMIKNVLECSFQKVVLDHLIIENDLILEPGKVKSAHYNKHTRTKKRPKTSGNICNNKFKVATTSDIITLEYYQLIYTHCKQRFEIRDGIIAFKKTLFQYIKNRINNYLFGNYNITTVKRNLLENILHYSNTKAENIKKYPANAQFVFELESEPETSSNKRQRDNQSVHTTPNTPKILFKHLQTPEQGTKNFTSLRSLTRQQKPLQTSSNLLDFLAENQSEHSETAANEENELEISEEESIDSKNEEDKMTTYIAKIPEFNGEDIETSPQEWLNQVIKAEDTNGWNAARMLRTISYFLKGMAGEWFENLATLFNNWNAFKAAFLEQFTDNNTSITLHNHF
ncbi:hypothetical protein G9A89_023676 [Geosiphon pyriformis]|nr:hypothetical protein G9A89_023676 [Geosiphon pyriformis]